MKTIIPLNYTLWNNPESVFMRIDLKGLLDSLGIDTIFGDYSQPWVYDPSKLVANLPDKPILLNSPELFEYFTDTYDKDGYIGIRINRIEDDYFNFDGELALELLFNDESIAGYYPELKNGIEFVFQVRSSNTPSPTDHTTYVSSNRTFRVSNVKTSVKNADVQFQVGAYDNSDDVVHFKDMYAVMNSIPTSKEDNKTYELTYTEETGVLDLFIKRGDLTVYSTSAQLPSSGPDLSSSKSQEVIKHLFDGYFRELELTSQLNGNTLTICLGEAATLIDLSPLTTNGYSLALVENTLTLNEGSKVISSVDLKKMTGSDESSHPDISALEAKINSLLSNKTRMTLNPENNQQIEVTLDDGKTIDIPNINYPMVTGLDSAVNSDGKLSYLVSNDGRYHEVDLSKLVNPKYYIGIDKTNISAKNPNIIPNIKSFSKDEPTPTYDNVINGFELLDMVNIVNAKAKQFQTTNNISLETSPSKPGVITLRDAFMNKTYDVNLSSALPLRARTLKCKMFDPGSTMLTERKGDIVTVIFKQDNNETGFKFNSSTILQEDTITQLGDSFKTRSVYLTIRSQTSNFVNVGYRPRYLAVANVRDVYARIIGSVIIHNDGSVLLSLDEQYAINYYKKGYPVLIDQLTYITNDPYPTQDTGTIE